MESIGSDWIALAWIVVGILLIVSEVAATGFIAVFFGIAAVITGMAIVFGLPADGPWSWLLFSVLSVGMLVALRQRFSEWFRGTVLGSGASPGANEDFIGREATVLRGFGGGDNGRGEVEYRGTSWAARSDAELTAGAIVRITAMDNITLIVSPQED